MSIREHNGIIWNEEGHKFRVKFRLSDGRLIYPTKGGRFQLFTKYDLIADPFIEDAFLRGGYSESLGLYAQRTLFERGGTPFLTITETIPEPEADPIDPSAFVLGAVPATDFAKQM